MCKLCDVFTFLVPPLCEIKNYTRTVSALAAGLGSATVQVDLVDGEERNALVHCPQWP